MEDEYIQLQESITELAEEIRISLNENLEEALSTDNLEILVEIEEVLRTALDILRT